MLNIFKILIRLVIPVAILLWSAACSRQPRHEATYAYVRSIIDSVPERALEILDSIPADRLQPGLDSARYILLHATAENKLHNLTTSDSLLKYILPIFKENNLTQETIHANYLIGRFLVLDNKFEDAMEYLMDAEDQLDENTTSYEKGLIYHTIADCYVNFLNGPSAIEYVDKAAVEFTKANLPIHYLYALSDKGIYLNNGMEYKKAENIFNQVLDSLKVYESEDIKMWCYDGLFRSMIGQDRYKEALEYYDFLSQTTDSIDDTTLGLMLIAERKAGSIQKADSLAISLLKAGNFWGLNEINFNEMPSEYLANAFYKQNEYNSDLIVSSYSESYPVLLRKNLELNKELNHELIKNKKLTDRLYITILLSLFIILSVIIYLFYRRSQYQKKEKALLYKDFIHFIQAYNKTLSDSSDIYSSSRKIIDKLLTKHALSLNTIIEVYYSNPDFIGPENKRIVRFIKESIDSISKKPEVLKDFGSIVNIKYDGIIDNLIMDIPSLKEEEILLFTLTASGFNNTTIAYILHATTSNHVAVKKTQLRKKIASQLPPVKAFPYLRAME